MRFRHSACAVCAGIFLLFALTPSAVAQAEATGAQSASRDSASPPEDYRIGQGDVISVSVADAPEFGGKFRVGDSGLIQIPGVSSPIHAVGQTSIELSNSIRDALIDAKQLRNPQVTVFIDEFHGRTVTVLGAVTKPGVYPLERTTTVLDALSLANGPLPNAGTTVTIVRGRASAETTGTLVGSVQILDMNKLLKGKDLSANVEVQNGDIISVSNAEVVYVVGAVAKPGGFALPDPASGMSVVQALAMAQGFTKVAATHRGLILRESTNGSARQLIPVDVAQLADGKQTDMLLAPNDILYIPESGTKKALNVMGEVAMSAVNGVAIYGLGYRVGNVP
jgi:polysaccharide biosynthesis/export protein